MESKSQLIGTDSIGKSNYRQTLLYKVVSSAPHHEQASNSLEYINATTILSQIWGLPLLLIKKLKKMEECNNRTWMPLLPVWVKGV